jgi:hypothetical protein
VSASFLDEDLVFGADSIGGFLGVLIFLGKDSRCCPDCPFSNGEECLGGVLSLAIVIGSDDFTGDLTDFRGEDRRLDLIRWRCIRLDGSPDAARSSVRI